MFLEIRILPDPRNSLGDSTIDCLSDPGISKCICMCETPREGGGVGLCHRLWVKGFYSNL